MTLGRFLLESKRVHGRWKTHRAIGPVIKPSHIVRTGKDARFFVA